MSLRSRQPTEYQIHASIAQWAELMRVQGRYPRLDMLYHVPNGEHRRPRVGARLKRMGTKPGVPDLNLDLASRGFHGFRMEIKAPGGRTKKEQEVFLRRLSEEGYFVTKVFSLEEAIERFEWYLESASGRA